MSNLAEVAEVAEAMAAEALAERGPAPLKARGGRLRPVVVVDAEGKPVKVVDSAALLQGLLKREGVEVAVEGKRPRVILCADCGKPVSVPRVPQGGGAVPQRCKRCGPVHARRGWVESHPDEVREKSRRASASPAGKKRRQRWADKNRESLLGKKRLYEAQRRAAKKAANPDEVRAKNVEAKRRSYQKHKDRIQAARRAARAKARSQQSLAPK